MAASSRKVFHRASAAAVLFATVACADNLMAPTTSAGSLTVGVLSLDKKAPPTASARGFIDNNGNTVFEVSTTGAWDDPGPHPGQLTHVHFKLCEGSKYISPTKNFSANFHYKDAPKVDQEPDYEVDDADDPSYKNGPNRVNWDRSSSNTTIEPGGYSSGFIFRGLRQNDLVEVKIHYTTRTPRTHKGETVYDKSDHKATLCVPVMQAPSPALTSSGFIGITGNAAPSTGTAATYTAFVIDGVGTANVRAICNFYVDGVFISSAPVTVDAVSGGVCRASYTFPEGSGGAHIVSVRLSDVYPVDWDADDNSAPMTVQVSGTSPDGVETVSASFSAVNTLQTVVVAVSSSITAYSAHDSKSVITPPITPGDRFPVQGSTVAITMKKAMTGPFDVSANVTTSGSPNDPGLVTVASPIASFRVSGLYLDPNALRGPTGLPLARGEQCTPFVNVDNPEGYQVQVCVTEDAARPQRNKTVFTFETHANMYGSQGRFVPYGTKLTFDADFVSGGVHYRVTPQDIDLRTTVDAQRQPICTRYAVGSVSATCSYSPGSNTTRPENAERSIFGLVGTPQ